METFACLVLSGSILTADGLLVRKIEYVDNLRQSVVVRVGGRVSDVIRVPFSNVRAIDRADMRPETVALIGGAN